MRNKLYFTLIGGMMSLVVRSKTEDLVKCEVIDGGELKSRRHLNVRGKSATLPSITGYFLSFFFSIWLVRWTWICILFCGHKVCANACLCHFFFSAEKDWEDIKFGVDNKVDYYAVSFVKDAKVVHELKDYLRSKSLHLFPTTIHWFFSLQFTCSRLLTNHHCWRRITKYILLSCRLWCRYSCDCQDWKCWFHTKPSLNHFCVWWGKPCFILTVDLFYS